MEALGAAGSVESFKGPPKVLENHWALGKAAHARGEHVPPFPCPILQTNLFPAESLSAHILKPFGPLVFAPHILKPFALGVRQGKMEMWFEWEPPWWFFNAKPLSCIAHLLAIRRSWLDCTEEDTPGLVCCGAPKWVPNRCDSSCRTFAMGKGPCSRDPRRSKSNRRSACVQKRYLPNHRRSFAFSHMLCIYVYCIVYSMFIYPHAMYPQGPYTVYPDLFIRIYIYYIYTHFVSTLVVPVPTIASVNLRARMRPIMDTAEVDRCVWKDMFAARTCSYRLYMSLSMCMHTEYLPGYDIHASFRIPTIVGGEGYVQ